MTSAIEVCNIVKKYPKLTALNDVSLNIQQGEFFGLLGPNGAGKTTLISILAGLAQATEGQARIMGYDVRKEYQQARRMLGVVPQELAFDPFFTVRETLKWQSGYFGIQHNDDWIEELLHHLGLTDKAHVNMRALSGGMKRRVLVAQALVHRPKVIILDEPTAGVDVQLRQSLWAFITRLHREGHTIVLTTHYLEEAEQMCDRIAVLKQGQLVALDRTSTLLQQLTGVRLLVKTHNTLEISRLPQDIQNQHREQGQTGQNRHQFILHAPGEVETVLTELRLAGAELEDVLVAQADLEDVFVKLLQPGTANPTVTGQTVRAR